MTSFAPPRVNPPVSRFFLLRSRDLCADFPQTFRKTGGINSKTGVFVNVILTSFFNPAVLRIEFLETRSFSGKCRGYLALILRFAESCVAVKHKTRT